MKVIGLTGGIGSGKSTVARIMKERYGFYVIDTDSLGHQVLLKGENGYQQVKQLFGTKVIGKDGQIDRNLLGNIVFQDKDQLKKLNEIVHPEVRKKVLNILQEEKTKGNYEGILVETALLIEANYQEFCDEIWYVYASEEIRQKRLCENRGYTKEKTEAIFRKQQTEEQFQKNADFIINNSTTQKELQRQIEKRMKC